MRICFFGDSFINGTGDPTGLGWVGHACRDLWRPNTDATVYNLGVRRDTSADVLKRWQAEAGRRLDEQDDNRLVFSFGVNDCLIEPGGQRVLPVDTMSYSLAILSRAKTHGPVLFVGPPPVASGLVNQRLERLNIALEELCVSLSVPYLDTYSFLVEDSTWMGEVQFGDGAHPGEAGYTRLAHYVNQWQPWLSWWR